MAPLWDFCKGQFVGVLSALDFILILREVSVIAFWNCFSNFWDDQVIAFSDEKKQVRLDRKSLMELDEERSASAVAANNAMAMINRLQADKAAVRMESLQYQRMMEEQAEYDEEVLQATNEMLLKR
ncbi:hypothetical protein RJT34_06586 [Clitoria ternatea]|uniref:GTD-binding domain-containing protein n=1 Tax=Clitoria ternatea TaxID=43366 RepID=A0AAN9K5S1_CLITE